MNEEFAEAHWVDMFGGNGGYAGSFRLNPTYQVFGAALSACQRPVSGICLIVGRKIVNSASSRAMLCRIHAVLKAGLGTGLT